MLTGVARREVNKVTRLKKKGRIEALMVFLLEGLKAKVDKTTGCQEQFGGIEDSE